MKKIVLFISLLLFINPQLIKVHADYVSYVYTPLGNQVLAYMMQETSDEVRAQNDAQMLAEYPNAIMMETYYNSPSTIKYSSTRRFNCHGYAWYMSTQVDPLSDPRWIGYDIGNTDEYIYWQDGSYKEVASITYPGMVSWASGDHSAITTSQSGWVISKWADMPFMKHRIEDSPYGSSNLKYYVKNGFLLTGPTYICQNENFTLTVAPWSEYCTVSWSYSSNITLVSSSGNQTMFRASNDASTWVKANITVRNKSTEIIKNISIDVPPYSEFYYDVWNNSTGQHLTPSSSTYYNVLCYNTTYHIKLESMPIHTLTNYQWTIPSGWTKFYTSGNMVSINTNSTPGGQVSVSATTSCGVTKSVFSAYFGPALDCVSSSSSTSLSVYPNPATDMLTIELKEGPATEKDVLSTTLDKSVDTDKYEIQIWNSGSIVKQLTTNQSFVQISIQDLSPGLYFVLIQKDGKTYSQKLFVE